MFPMRVFLPSTVDIYSLITDGLISMAETAIRNQQRVVDGAGVSFGRNGKWSFHERTITGKLRDLERGAISLQRFLNYSFRFFHLEGVANFVDEEFEEGWEEDIFNDEVGELQDEEYYTPPGEHPTHLLIDD